MTQARIDLSKLPEPLRQKFQQRLDALPADIREKLGEKLSRLPPQALAAMLERGAPMLDRVLGSLEPSHGAAATSTKPAATVHNRIPTAHAGGLRDHYNNTVQRGDRLSLPLGLIILVITGLFLVLYQGGY